MTGRNGMTAEEALALTVKKYEETIKALDDGLTEDEYRENKTNKVLVVTGKGGNLSGVLARMLANMNDDRVTVEYKEISDTYHGKNIDYVIVDEFKDIKNDL